MASRTENGASSGPPYPAKHQILGQVPTVLPDVPASAVFLALFIIGGAAHMFVLKRNERKGKKFAINGMTFGFCITRIIATTLRIAWAFYPRNISLGMSAMIFVYAGVILLFIGQLFFTQRIIRAQHPRFGWSKPFSIILPVLLGLMIATVLCLIVAVVVMFYVLDSTAQRYARIVQCVGAVEYAVVAFIPLVAVPISSLARFRIRHTKTIDKFGEGSMRAKIAIVLVCGVFLCLGACFRASTTLLPPVDILTDASPPQPVPEPWYFSKACFYTFNFTIEISVVFFWLAIRIDKRFIIPNGAKGPFSYSSGGFIFAGDPGNEKADLSQMRLMGSSTSGLHNSIGRGSTWTGSRLSEAQQSRISWGGLSRDDITLGLGEDGMEVMPYPALYPTSDVETDIGVDGAEAEMGWDPRTGKWALRPVSLISLPRPSTSRQAPAARSLISMPAPSQRELSSESLRPPPSQRDLSSESSRHPLSQCESSGESSSHQ